MGQFNLENQKVYLIKIKYRAFRRKLKKKRNENVFYSGKIRKPVYR